MGGAPSPLVLTHGHMFVREIHGSPVTAPKAPAAGQGIGVQHAQGRPSLAEEQKQRLALALARRVFPTFPQQQLGGLKEGK